MYVTDHMHKMLKKRGVIPKWASKSLAASYLEQQITQMNYEQESSYKPGVTKKHCPQVTVVADNNVGITAYWEKSKQF